MLELVNVTKTYRDVAALRGVSLEVRSGEIKSLLGPNGAGKSTLISIAAGLRRPDSGEVRVAGFDVFRNPRHARRHLGIAPQELGIYYPLTVRQNLVLFARLAGIKRRALAASIERAADALSLTALLNKKAVQLSGGERRRLHTAMALIHLPPLLLLDEPTAGADVTTRGRILQVIKDLAGEGAAVLYTTHYLPEVESIGGTLSLIRDGQIVGSGQVSSFISNYPSLEAAYVAVLDAGVPVTGGGGPNAGRPA